MSESGRRHEALRAGAPVACGPVMMLPIERVRVEAQVAAGGVWFSALRAPCALVVRAGGELVAARVDGAPVAMDDLLAEVPGLAAAIARLAPTPTR